MPPAGEQLAPSGQRARAQANLAALEMLLRLRQEQRAAGPGEQRVLAAWSGCGAVAQLFDEDREDRAPMRERLRELAGEQGHQAARRTTINAHYTAPHVAAAMREAMQALGSDRGRVLEPGCAAGIFLGLAPAGAELVGVELDPRPRRSRPRSTRTPRCAPSRLRPRACPTATSTWRSERAVCRCAASRGCHPDDALAHAELVGLDTQAREERARVVSNCTEIIDAYKDSTALATAEQPNFDPHRFIDTADTIYVAAPNEAQDKLAPIVVGLLSHIRAAVYARGRTDDPPVLFMLDECANIARLPDLPAMLSEAGGQGLQTVCVFQDISQVRRLWAADADGFLSLFHSKVVLRGIADMRTLDQLSLLCGEYDRNIKTESHHRPAGGLFAPAAPATRTTSFTTRRERIVPPDRIAAIQLGEALVIRGTEWEFVPTTPYDQQPVLKELTNGHQ